MDFEALMPHLISGIVSGVAAVTVIRVELKWLRRDVDELRRWRNNAGGIPPTEPQKLS
jgi:hypothetical protein